ncbi:hypothetical protein J7E70_07835 [Variovorax paradoxus]|nr:hypothetical protein [Variovorax paradoxus]MBT2300373.1 hypothetical protein [Variovorax paradoxus]
MTTAQEIYNADRAKEVLENEAFHQAFHDIKQELTEQWKTSPARDLDGREKLFLMLKMLEKVEICLKASLDSGTLAKEKLKYEQSLLDRAKASIGWE